MCHKIKIIKYWAKEREKNNGESENGDGTQSARCVNKSIRLIINLR